MSEFEFKGTPGPWVAHKSKDYGGHVIYYIAQQEGAPYTPNYSDVGQTCAGDPEHIQRANALAKAAAPELIAVARTALLYAESKGNDLLANQARAALAKATGQENTNDH